MLKTCINKDEDSGDANMRLCIPGSQFNNQSTINNGHIDLDLYLTTYKHVVCTCLTIET